MHKYIDLRSDTVTKPSQLMRKAMYDAEVGDDVYQEDPTVNELQEYAADLLGKEAALYVMSGVMGNQICLNVITNPGDEVICEEQAHIFHYESGSPAALSGIQLFPVKGSGGIVDPTDLKDKVRPKSAYYMPRSKVIAVENTHNRAGGAVIPLDKIKELGKFTHDNGLYYHLDGARLWNASVAAGVSLKDYAEPFDTMSCCLSKGLGAPVGSIIAGSKDFIKEAFRVRKAWGGGTRQVGVLAAAGLFALKNNIERLSEDHEKARILAEVIDGIPNLKINIDAVQTNILIFEPTSMTVEEAIAKCKEEGLLISVGTAVSLRAITHLDVEFEDVQQASMILQKVFG